MGGGLGRIKFKPGDRVNVDGFVTDKFDRYTWAVMKGTVSEAWENSLKVNFDRMGKSNPYIVPPRVCRRLKKKKRLTRRNILVKKIVIPDRCGKCRFMCRGNRYHSPLECLIYDRSISDWKVDIYKTKPDWCKAKQVVIDED